MTNEYDAMRQLADSKVKAIQDSLRDRNQQTLLSERLEKERKSEAFWQKVWITADSLFVLIIVYTIFHFA